MKTLLFAPLFLDEGDRYQRNTKWIDYLFQVLKPHLDFDEILFVDNASGPKLEQFKLHIKPYESVTPITIIECKTRLKRNTEHAYGYWYSAFGKAARYAKENGFDRIIHIDTDVYVLNKRMCDYVNDFRTGWVSMWCDIHKYPETTFQFIGSDQFDRVYEFMTRDFLQFYPNGIAEHEIPWTHVEKSFNGDRFPERGMFTQDPSWDWVGQTPVSMVIKFNG